MLSNQNNYKKNSHKFLYKCSVHNKTKVWTKTLHNSSTNYKGQIFQNCVICGILLWRQLSSIWVDLWIPDEWWRPPHTHCLHHTQTLTKSIPRVCFSKRWRHVNVSAFKRFHLQRRRHRILKDSVDVNSR